MSAQHQPAPTTGRASATAHASARVAAPGAARTRAASARAEARPASPGRAAASAQPAGGRQTSRPVLSVVRAAAPARATVPFLVLVALILAGALVASMVLNAGMADTAFKMHKAQVELNVVNDHIVTVRTELQKASSPGTLAERASELGMVPAGAPGVVDLSQGTVSGGQAAQPAHRTAGRGGT